MIHALLPELASTLGAAVHSWGLAICPHPRSHPLGRRSIPSSGDRLLRPGTSQSSATVDQCLVGSWKSTQVVSVDNENGSSVPVVGSGGGILTVAADGTWTRDYTGEAPMSGQLDGTPVAGTRSGRQVLRIKASGGHLDVISIESSTEKSSISVGDVVGEVTPRAPRAAGIPYTCDRSTLMVFGDTYRRSSAPSRYGEAGCLPRRIESGAGVESSEPLAKG